MNLIVRGEKGIGVFQQEFHEEFPFLKIEFFQSKTSSKNKIPAGKTFEAFKTNRHSESITITPSMTVAEIGHKFSVHYDLLALVYRQSGKVWLETTLTDNWTLQEQNDEGRALSG